ncbi:MAG: Fic family protein [Gammaproteobacteria bacterium]|nr:Fic family protein [Gammaproteobacteria bacterium]
MSKYNWQQPDWPHFKYDLTNSYNLLSSIAEKNGRIFGKLYHLDQSEQTEMMISLMVEEAVKTSEIEGDYINSPDVRSSIRNQLGLNQQKIKVHDTRANGLAELMLDLRNTFNEPLSEEKLFDWHMMLMASNPDHRLRVGYWRTHDEPMQVISGQMGRTTVHFEAPPSENIIQEMANFIEWFNQSVINEPKEIAFGPVRSAIAHLYFESIHPFEDGNGRIGRAIAEKALSQGLGYPVILSLSKAIEADKKAYYKALNIASHSNEITAWIEYFINIILAAQNRVEQQINFILKKADYYKKYRTKLNGRQLKIIDRMLQAGEQGFVGGMSAKKYMAITRISKATATRDLQNLLALGAIRQLGEGRSVRYELNI